MSAKLDAKHNLDDEVMPREGGTFGTRYFAKNMDRDNVFLIPIQNIPSPLE